MDARCRQDCGERGSPSRRFSLPRAGRTASSVSRTSSLRSWKGTDTFRSSRRQSRAVPDRALGRKYTAVIAGLDPAIYLFRMKVFYEMDPRVKPGGDERGGATAETNRPHHTLQHALPSGLRMPPFGHGLRLQIIQQRMGLFEFGGKRKPSRRQLEQAFLDPRRLSGLRQLCEAKCSLPAIVWIDHSPLSLLLMPRPGAARG